MSCISRHVFGGLALGDLSLDRARLSENTSPHSNRCIDMAQALDCPLVRIMSFKKEMILFGSHGAEEWNVAQGAWDKARELIGGAAQIAEDRDITLVVETGNNAPNQLRLPGAQAWLDDVGSERLKVMWDPANALYSMEAALPRWLRGAARRLSRAYSSQRCGGRNLEGDDRLPPIRHGADGALS